MTQVTRTELIRLTRTFQEAVLNHRTRLSEPLCAFPHPESERAAAFTFARLLAAQGYPGEVLSLPPLDDHTPAQFWVLAGRYHIQPTVIQAENRLPAVGITRPRAHKRVIPTRMPELEAESELEQVEAPLRVTRTPGESLPGGRE